MVLGALASCSLLVAGANARAAYTYTSMNIMAGPPPAGITDTFTPVAGTVPADTAENLALVTFTSTGTGSGSQSVSWTQAFASTTGSMEVFSISGTLTYIFGAPLFLPSSVTITPISGSGFTLTPSGNTATTLNFVVVPPSVVGIPEPSSVVLMGMGLVGALGIGVRRLRKATA
jgi:hypothetical protein